MVVAAVAAVVRRWRWCGSEVVRWCGSEVVLAVVVASVAVGGSCGDGSGGVVVVRGMVMMMTVVAGCGCRRGVEARGGE
ncbi:hypothetical protein Tco_1014100 [Tanacetum coccineum]